MSLIKLQGNASGTGAFTIAAPNSNSDRTLTLPDATGTVNVSGLANEVPAGSAGAPAIYPTGDSNTGIFFPAADTIAFAEGGVEAARFDASGNLLVGKTSADGLVSISSAATAIPSLQVDAGSSSGVKKHGIQIDWSGFYWGASNQVALHINDTRTAAATDRQVQFSKGGSVVGRIDCSLTATSYVTSSDYRLKQNVQPMTGALDKIAQLNPVTYTWKADGSAGQGFLAHELQAVVPDCVSGEKDAVDAEGNPQYQGVDTSFLVATLVKAIQELTARVAQLEAK